MPVGLEEVPSMTHVSVAAAPPQRRPRPGPGRRPEPAYRVAPPVVDAFGPWAAILAAPDTAGDLDWAMGPDGVLIPVCSTGTGAAIRSKSRAVRGRLAAFVNR
jgi:hypothetical protein